MIRIIKIGDNIYERIEPKSVDEKGNEIWLIPNDYEKLKNSVIDTLGWIVFKKLKDSFNSIDKQFAVTSKSIVLLFKIVNSLNPDLSILTDAERAFYENMNILAENGYSDSQLINTYIEKLSILITWYNDMSQQVQQLNTVDELVQFLETLEEPQL